MGWEGGAETNFEKDNSALSNSIFETKIINAMTQVLRGILSTIVATLIEDSSSDVKDFDIENKSSWEHLEHPWSVILIN